MPGKLLIVGIDPGTTTGIAIMDLNGELILLKSRKGFSRAGICRFVLEQGNLIIIGSDKFSTPRVIEKLAAIFSARMIVPEKSLSRLVKKRLADSFAEEEKGHPWRNQHERDALVAALFAWNRIKSLVRRIEKKLRVYEGRSYYEKLNRYVKVNVLLKGQNINKSIKEFLKRKGTKT